jgi:hypothetical protein
MLNYNGQNYISLFNNNNIDLSQNTSDMIILDENGNLIIANNVISNQFLFFNNSYMLFGSDDLNNPIETKINNNYIIDETISIIKINGLS